ncbi:hypothetical protein BJX64DRAFT_250539 [Aspergillus heterothallicus]
MAGLVFFYFLVFWFGFLFVPQCQVLSPLSLCLWLKGAFCGLETRSKRIIETRYPETNINSPRNRSVNSGGCCLEARNTKQ